MKPILIRNKLNIGIKTSFSSIENKAAYRVLVKETIQK